MKETICLPRRYLLRPGSTALLEESDVLVLTIFSMSTSKHHNKGIFFVSRSPWLRLLCGAQFDAMRSASAVVFWLLSYATAECPSKDLPPPERHSDGVFLYPNGAPQCFSRGSQMNVSWCSVYDAVNLYLAQGDDYFTTAVGIVSKYAEDLVKHRPC